jgi:hypothetical protein
MVSYLGERLLLGTVIGVTNCLPGFVYDIGLQVRCLRDLGINLSTIMH